MKLRGNERVLDYDSGSDVCSRHIAARLQPDGWLDCVDVSRGWQTVIRKTLRRYNNIDYHLGFIATIDLPDSAFDVVVIYYVLHDIPAGKLPSIVNTLGRKLKPRGRLVVREPQGHGLSLDELNQLMATAKLHPSYIMSQKVFIGKVYDGCFIRNKEIQ